MPTFNYKAKKGPDRSETGTIEAEDRDQAIAKLIQNGLMPVEVTVQDRPIAGARLKFGLKLNRRLGLKELNIFTQQLRTLIKSRVELLSSLRILYEQSDNESLKNIILDLYNTIKDGKTFSAALSKHSDFFPLLYINIIRSGEASGRLDEALGEMSNFLEREQDLRIKIRAALAYPVLMIIVGLVTIFVLFSFVIPRLVGIFEDFQAALPLPTRILLSISSFFQHAWFFIIIFIVAAVFILRRQSLKGRLGLDWLKLNLPLLGNLNRKQMIGRFNRTLSLLLHSGTPLFQSLQIAIPTLENNILIKQLESVPKDVMAGGTLSESMKKVSYFEPFLIQMIKVGEEGGRLEGVLNEVADSFSREAEASIKIITSLIEPLVILFLGLILGGIVMAMLLPIFQINMLIR
jgi:type II secretory pathway component PulF